MPKKIFELAKELEIGPLDLVETLRNKGFQVRNHMSSLTDDEVVQIQGFYKESQSVAKTTKKKVTKAKKKKVAKKVVVKKTVSKDSEEATVVKAAPKARLKKTVLRKKGPSEDEENQNDDENLNPPVQPAPPAPSAFEEALKNEIEIEPRKEVVPVEPPKKVTGLRVVSRPEVGEDSEEEESKKKVKTTSKEDDDDTTVEYDEDGKEKKKDTDSKKRLGGLAVIMSGKRPVKRAEAINQVRAEQELKSYSTLSSLGKPIYMPVKKKKIFHGQGKSTVVTDVKDSKRVIHINKGCSVEELAQKLSTKMNNIIDKVLDINLLVKANDYVGIGLASEIAALYNYRVVDSAFDEQVLLGKNNLSDEEKEKLPLRNPIVAIMGHVDHGKTTLLDYIRNAKVAQGEAGGITQHIGAYTVDVKNKGITFLDTPGHAAFASMRQRGANLTDVVVLVVAADDGVMPQTKESIKYCQNAGVPIIVAVNKMDKEGANPDRVKTGLSECGLNPEEWGGETQFVPISALKGDGVDDLLEAIALQSEILELRADTKGFVKGVVIESKVEQGRGPVATLLIQNGTLKKGDCIVVGESFGRARSLIDFQGNQLPSAGPSMPVQVIGLDNPPSPGDDLNLVNNEREGKKIIQNRINERKLLEQVPLKPKVSLEDFFANAASEGVESKKLNLVIRTDVNGSFEAIKQSLETLGNKEVEVRVVGGGVGPVSESDVLLTDSAGGIILGFNMRPSTSARKLAEDKGVEIKTYSVIYELINDVKLALEGLLEPEYIEEYVGRAEVKDTFVIPKVGTIAGSQVIEGRIVTGCSIRLLREGKIVFDGKMSSLKRFKDEVKEVKNGLECGIGLENYNDVKIGDLFEAYKMVEKRRKLEDVGISPQPQA